MKILNLPTFLASLLAFLAATVPCLAASNDAPAAAVDVAGKRPFYERGPEGWWWYEDRPAEQDEKPAAKPADKPSPAQATAKPMNQDERDLVKFKAFQKSLEDAGNIAAINPSDRNMLRWMELLAESRRKAAVFTDSGLRVAALNPSVDDRYNGMNLRPATPAATAAWDAEDRRLQQSRLEALSRTHGIFFFFKSDCPYCHAYAPLLKRFAQKYGLTVIAVSMDGGPIAEFPDARVNNGIAGRVVDQLGIPREQFVVPFTVLAKPSTQEVLPLGFGVMNETELTERLDLFASEFERAARDPRSPGWQPSPDTAQALMRLQGTTTSRAQMSPVGVTGAQP